MLNSIRLVNRLRKFPFSRKLFSSHAQLSSNSDLGFKTSYDKEATKRVLAVVNTSSLIDFKNYQISNQRIQRIIKRRESKGNFESIEDLLEVDGFGIKILEKFCKSIIDHKPAGTEAVVDKLSVALKKEIIENPKRQHFVTPVMLEVIRNRLKTVVSFHADLNYLAWTKFYYDSKADETLDEPKFYLEGWNCYEFASKEKHLRLNDLVELLVKFNGLIPQADVYTLESLPPAVQAKQPGNALQVNVNIQKAQLIAILCGLMASRRSTNKLFNDVDMSTFDLVKTEQEMPYIDSVYYLKNFLSSRLYRIFVGNERVSAGNVIDEIIKYNYTMHDKVDPTFASVNIPEEYRDFWKKSSRVHQEYLGSSMLIGLTFLKLCVERCSGSVERLNYRAKKV